MHRWLLNFCSKHTLISDEQHCFQPMRSCTTALLRYNENIRRSIISKNIGLACFVDLQIAFVTVNQDIFLLKLKQYSIIINLLCWFIDFFLMDRKQYVATTLGSSDVRNFHCGVPHGWVCWVLLCFCNASTICPLIAVIQTFVFLRMIQQCFSHRQLLLMPKIF